MARTAALALVLFCCASAATASVRSYRVDPERTTVTFTVRAGWGAVGGKIARPEGLVLHDPVSRAAARVDATVPLNTLSTGDPSRDRMLKGPDWFDVARWPEMRFVSEGARDDGRSARIRGTLTLRGVSRPVELVSVARDQADGSLRFVAEAEIDRRAFGMTRLPGLVSDRVKVRVEGVAVAR